VKTLNQLGRGVVLGLLFALYAFAALHGCALWDKALPVIASAADIISGLAHQHCTASDTPAGCLAKCQDNLPPPAASAPAPLPSASAAGKP
jgi:hypothetical protein